MEADDENCHRRATGVARPSSAARTAQRPHAAHPDTPAAFREHVEASAIFASGIGERLPTCSPGATW
ncbi:MAG: hypothetical protein LC121_02535 [Anaerolineae bacterium]|nr:hypothetical protein [Anaerolineae bacterium]